MNPRTKQELEDFLETMKDPTLANERGLKSRMYAAKTAEQASSLKVYITKACQDASVDYN